MSIAGVPPAAAAELVRCIRSSSIVRRSPTAQLSTHPVTRSLRLQPLRHDTDYCIARRHYITTLGLRRLLLLLLLPLQGLSSTDATRLHRLSPRTLAIVTSLQKYTCKMTWSFAAEPRIKFEKNRLYYKVCTCKMASCNRQSIKM